MTTLTPDERAAAVEALKYIRAGFFRTSDERTICHGDLSKMVEAAERAIALLSGPPAFARPATAVETAARALVERMEPIYDYAAYDLGWKREFLALKAALAATEGGQ